MTAIGNAVLARCGSREQSAAATFAAVFPLPVGSEHRGSRNASNLPTIPRQRLRGNSKQSPSNRLLMNIWPTPRPETQRSHPLQAEHHLPKTVPPMDEERGLHTTARAGSSRCPSIPFDVEGWWVSQEEEAGAPYGFLLVLCTRWVAYHKPDPQSQADYRSADSDRLLSARRI